MKKINNYSTRALFLILVLFIASCSDDENNPLGLPFNEDGFFIVNEGAFGNSNTTLSFYSYESGEVTNNLFIQANERPLGDQSQSMTIHGNEGFIVVQNSAKVEVIRVRNFESLATISEGLESPRYFIGLNDNKGYVSDWGSDGFSGSVKIVDLSSFTVTGSITTDAGSNEMVIRDNMLYVANSGGFGVANTISVIDTSTDQVVQTIETGDNPANLELDESGNIWVLGRGSLAFDAEFNLVVEESTPGFISRIPANNTIDLNVELTDITFSTADDLTIDADGDIFFNYNGAVYELSASGSVAPFISRGLYGLAVDPSSNLLIGTEAPDFSSGGNLIFFDENGSTTSTLTVGIGPNSCIFKL